MGDLNAKMKGFSGKKRAKRATPVKSRGRAIGMKHANRKSPSKTRKRTVKVARDSKGKFQSKSK